MFVQSIMNLTDILQTVILFCFIWRTGFVCLNKRISKMFLQSSLLHFDAWSDDFRVNIPDSYVVSGSQSISPKSLQQLLKICFKSQGMWTHASLLETLVGSSLRWFLWWHALGIAFGQQMIAWTILWSSLVGLIA